MFDEMARKELLGRIYIRYKLQNISHFLVIASPMWLCWSSIWGANISKIRNILEFVCSVDAAFMLALHDDLTHDWTNHRDMIIFKTVFRKFYLGAPPLPAKLISYLKTVCVTWHYANSQSCGIVRYLYYIRLMGSQMQPKRPATWVKYSKKSGCDSFHWPQRTDLMWPWCHINHVKKDPIETSEEFWNYLNTI